ncbi:FAD/NAD(P)-binding oxidoreductase family protein [Nannochloropsis gaditana]|uniref:FAD/NAD(P)-binding oxidoreductase family protein n=1 Tax=Nannochloropsis gaditana TaxID=72520 RepID=W7U7K3_9STRA|nr:FAD/NAD(P)-binding oxidoreductase family protein [Nannochloropsis gaditana]
MGKGAVMESSSSNVLSSTPTTLSPLAQRGPLVITHTGLSGPAILRLSAFAARLLALLDYQASFRIDWLPEFAYPDVVQRLQRAQTANARKHVGTYCPLLTTTAAGSVYVSRGKSIHKEEFTTAGGVALKEVDFKTFGSKRVEGLYFAGEILDVDGVTGGFNFMNCWSGGYIAGRSLAQRIIARDEDGKDGGREGQEGDRDTRGLGL